MSTRTMKIGVMAFVLMMAGSVAGFVHFREDAPPSLGGVVEVTVPPGSATPLPRPPHAGSASPSKGGRVVPLPPPPCSDDDDDDDDLDDR